jgi:hypothetical protein
MSELLLSPAQMERLKSATGIKCANCDTCAHLSSDNDGGEPEYSISWPVCDKFPTRHNLKTFPFKKEMPCWSPNFWASQFSEEINTGSDEEMKSIGERFCAACELGRTKPEAEKQL